MNAAIRKSEFAKWAVLRPIVCGPKAAGPTRICRNLNFFSDVILPPAAVVLAGSHGRGQGGEEEQQNIPNFASPTGDDEGGEVLVSRPCREKTAAKAFHHKVVVRPGEAKVQGVPH